MKDLLNSPLNLVYQHPDPDDALQHWLNSSLKLFEKHVTIREVKVKHNNKSPRITHKIVEIMRN